MGLTGKLVSYSQAPDKRLIEITLEGIGKLSEGVIRSTVIIDPKGRVAHRWAKVSAAGHADKVREKLAELRG